MSTTTEVFDLISYKFDSHLLLAIISHHTNSIPTHYKSLLVSNIRSNMSIIKPTFEMSVAI